MNLQNAEIFKELMLLKKNQGMFQFENFCSSKQCRTRKLFPFICRQDMHRSFAMLVSSVH